MLSALNTNKKAIKITTIVWLLLLLTTPLVLWLLPADFFDGEGGLILCPSRALFGFECLGCGMTRAVMHLHHLQWDDAAYYNRLSFIVYPALIVLWAIWTHKAFKKVFY